MDTVIISKSLIAASVNCISKAQTLAAAGNVVLNGGSVVSGVAVLDTARRVLITSDGDDSGITFTVTGANQGGNAITEIVSGVSAAAVASSHDFLNVGTVHASGAVANHVTIGTNGTGSTPWKNPNIHLTPFNVAIENAVTGTVTYNTEYTMDDFFTPGAGVPRVRSTVVNGATADTSFDFVSAVRGWRNTITAGTGTVTAEAIQAGIING